MPPNNQQTNPQDYNFIFNSQQPQRSGGNFGGGLSLKKKIITVVVLFLFIAIGGTIVSQIMGSGQKTLTNNLKLVVARQSEMIRVADMGIKDGVSEETIGYAFTVRMAAQTERSELIALLGKSGVELVETDMAASKNPQADEALKLAQANNRYDEELRARLEANLADYQKLIENVYPSVGPEMKTLLDKALASSDALLPDTPATTN